MNTFYLMPSMRHDNAWVATPFSRLTEATLSPDTDDGTQNYPTAREIIRL